MSRKKITDSVDFLGVSSRIKKVRGKLTQKEFGNILGVRDATISRYEAGRIPDVRTLKKIADYGGVTVEWLLHGGREAPSEEIIALKAVSEHASEIYQVQRPEPLEPYLLFQVLRVIDDFFTKNRLKPTLERKTRFIAKLYNHCSDNFEKPDQLLAEKYRDIS